MTPELHAQIKEVFVAACELDETRRQRYLQQACDGNPQLRDEVDRLLRFRCAESEDSTESADATATSAAAAQDDFDPSTGANARPRLVDEDQDERVFQPGTMIADRYRIVALLGRGGMGEVYRADDLKLSQPVALKFLPRRLAANDNWLTRFINEVRVARQVTHASVCRVYDIGESGGDHYLSMEYIDGEDLKSLLKRIGRLPGGKAVEIARQLCAGLAAAHAKGVLHRDLKPANVMIDGSGKVRITDFGLAGLAGEIEKSDFRAGTPAYMAPEQIAGEDVSIKSDLYSLGLVFYELFTGRPAFEAQSIREYAQKHQKSNPSAPSSIVENIDPEVERVIMRCLEKDPARRPKSALEVSAALPGGDPLAAALAAGETPSPEMVAAAGRERGVSTRVLAICSVTFVVLLATLITLSQKFVPATLGAIDKAPAVLAERAREIIGTAGLTSDPVDGTFAFLEYADFEVDGSIYSSAGRAWDQILRRADNDLVFWYRRADGALAPSDAENIMSHGGRVTPRDPPPTSPGMASVVLDPLGNLLLLQATPRLSPGAAPANGVEVDWSVYFSLAGFDAGQFDEIRTESEPRDLADQVRAWTGQHPDRDDIPIRVAAVSRRGRPVFFAVLERSEDRPKAPFFSAADRLRLSRQALGLTLSLLVLAAIPLAWRHVQQGRGDRRGAFRLSIFIFTMSMARWVLQAPHGLSFETELKLVPFAVASALLEIAMLWLFYMALEPYVRRFWPQMLISWSRLLAGRLKDAQVGRSVLFGSVLGAFWGLAMALGQLGRAAMGGIRGTPMRSASFADPLMGGRLNIVTCLELLRDAVYQGFMVLLLLVLLRILFRRQWPAAAGAVLVLGVIYVLPAGAQMPLAWLWVGVCVVIVGVLALIQFGLVTLVTGLFVASILLLFPITLDMQRWYSDTSLFALALCVGVSMYGAVNARRGPSTFSTRS